MHQLPSLGPITSVLGARGVGMLCMWRTLTLDLFTESVQRSEVICHLVYSLRSNFVFDGRGVTSLPMMVRTFSVRNTLFDVSFLLFSVALLNFYVIVFPGDHFFQVLAFGRETLWIFPLWDHSKTPSRAFLCLGGRLLWQLYWIGWDSPSTILMDLIVCWGWWCKIFCDSWRRTGVIISSPIPDNRWWKLGVNSYTIARWYLWRCHTTTCTSGSQSLW